MKKREKLLNEDQEKVFLLFSQSETHFQESELVKKQKKEDRDYDFFHERTTSNLYRLVTPDNEQFETIKEFLAMPAKLLVENFSERQILKYTHIFSVADMLATDWVYFPKESMRRGVMAHLKFILGSEHNFILCLTAEQKLALKN